MQGIPHISALRIGTFYAETGFLVRPMSDFNATGAPEYAIESKL